MQESFSAGIFDFRPGLRFEVFEQERIDRLNGSSYQDQTEMVILPGFSLSADLYGMKFLVESTEVYSPSSGAINIDMILVDYVDNGLDVLPEKVGTKKLESKEDFLFWTLKFLAFM